MKFHKIITLRDGRTCCLRNGTARDAKGALDVFLLTHQQTDNMRTYVDEYTMTVEEEARYLQDKTQSSNAIEILAEVDGEVVGSAGFDPVDSAEKLRHRAAFGIGVDQAFWGCGIGRALTQACIECARDAGYDQLELDVLATNERAIALYASEGFVEYGRNPRGFRSRTSGWQELVLMRLELTES